MSGSIQSDHNLLFGILALQRGFVRERDLIAAMHAWALVPGRALAELLVERRALTESQAREIDRLAGSRGSAPPQPPPPEPSPPTAAPEQAAPQRYRVIRSHARGGLGEVFLARDDELGREVALKQIQPRWADDPSSRKRFDLEARITGGLEHPGIVPVHGMGTDAEGKPYYAMRLVRGETLRDAIARHHRASPDLARPPRDLLVRFVTVCNTVAYAHSRGVVHRDLKPANVMLGPFGETLVVDWGLAKVLDTAQAFSLPAGTDTQISVPGVPFGSPAYVAPEQAAGRLHEIDERTDVYLLGGILFEILTGQPPHLSGRPAPPAGALAPGVPQALERVAARALDPARERRHQRAVDLAGDVDQWLAGEAEFATVAPVAAPSARPRPLDPTPLPTALREPVVALDAGRFRPVRDLAAGRTTAARLCHDVELNRPVVVKALRPNLTDDPAARAALWREAQVNAQMDHPNVRPLYGVSLGEADEPSLVLRYVRGQDLHEAVRTYHEGRPSNTDPELMALLGSFVDVCRAVAYAHSRGVSHGAVRPSNVLLGPDGRAALIDWGEAALRPVGGGCVELSARVEALATGGGATHCPNGDVFALGAMLYQVLVGRPPHSPLGRVRDRASWVPAELEGLCARAMAHDLDGRRLSADELGDEVAAYCERESAGILGRRAAARP